MTDQIKHECGLAMVRLLKPLEYYRDKYGTPLYGLNKLQILLQKQRNRGQDGAGVATIKFDLPPGNRYISRKRAIGSTYLKDLFEQIYANFENLTDAQLNDIDWLKKNIGYTGELLLGHLRYGTHGLNNIETVHPFLRQNNWISRNLVLAGNFNMTNIEELFLELLSFGQYPKEVSDTVTVLEKIGHFLDDEVQTIFDQYKRQGISNTDINRHIAKELDIARILSRSTRKFDGGYVMAGLIGHGDAFVTRDPAGIRPAYYYYDEEIVVMASERPAIQTAIDCRWNEIKELKPGYALIVKRDGHISETLIKDPIERKSCSFERIYFSRGTDRDIYLERKKLGKLLTPKVLEAIDYDFENTIFSFIPNTAEVSFFGLMEGVTSALDEIKLEKISKLSDPKNPTELKKIMGLHPRFEKLVVKDEKLRTFIANDVVRGELVSHVYDVTYGIVKNEVDTLVLIDDSIVRGTTLRDTIIYILSRLKPKKIIIVSSAPQIRYPDCYGIDMSRMKDFVAFKALLSLLEEDDKMHLLDKTYYLCKEEELKPVEEQKNMVIALFDEYSYEQISKRIAKIITPEGTAPEIDVIYQTVDDLHQACPNHTGDWYFTGNYPTIGGVRVVNRAFINYYEKIDQRAY